MGYYYCRCFGRDKKHVKDQQVLDVIISDKSPAVFAMNEKLERKSNAPAESKDNIHASPKTSATTFSYRELATATNNFRQEFLIGEGGFGLVYKGKLERTGQVVAVKQLNHLGSQGDKEFLVEVLMLSLLCHPNLVNLIGYCAEGEQRLLVYEFMSSGSLEDHLHDLKPAVQPLDWDARMRIAAGAAKGLDFLHNGADPPVIYRDLKSANILLDKEFNPKLSDFGLAKFGPDNDKSHVSTRVMGTEGYCAPEYAGTGKLTVKSDIYSFGVVLLELITGQKPLEMTRRIGKHSLLEWARPVLKDDPKSLARVADPLLRGQFPQASLCRAMEVAIMCVREDAQSRPSMKDVVNAMDFLTCQHFDPNAEGKDTSPRERQGQTNVDSNLGIENSLEKRLLSKNNRERQLAVAEAKLWGERCRDKRRQGLQSDTDDLSR